MLIRSQCKKIIVNLQSVSQFYLVRGEVVVDFNNADNSQSGYVTLGAYDSEESAIEILDAICKWYDESVVKAMKWPELYPINPVFQMPQDNEVES